MDRQSEEPGVPDWWLPERAAPSKRRLYDPTTRIKELDVDRLDTALDRVGTIADRADICLCPEPSRTSDGGYVATGVDRGRPITTYYRWTLERQDGAITATQDRYFPAWCRYAETLLPATLCALIATLWLSSSVTALSSLLLPLLACFSVSLLVFFGVTIVANYGQDPFDEIGGTSQPVPEPSLTRIGLVLVGVGPAVIVTELWPAVAATSPPGLVVDLGFASSVMLTGFAAIATLRLQYLLPAVPDFSQILPGGGAEYVFLSSLSLTPLVAFLAWFNGVFEMNFILLIGLLGLTTLAAVVAVTVLAVYGTELVEAFRRGGIRYVRSRWIHGTTFVLGAVLGWATVLACIATLRELPGILSAVQGTTNPLLLIFATTAVATVVPASYLVLGVVAQVCGLLMSVAWLFRAGVRAHRATTPVDETVPAPVLIVPDEEAMATALSVWPLTWVLIGDGLVDRLDEEELSAIAAHEFAHAGVYRDASLAILAPLIGTLTMTGQSVMLGLLDYRRREFRADRYAAGVTSPDAVEAALRTVSATRHNEFVGRHYGDGVGLLPTPAGVPRGGSSGPFSPIFDSVGVTEAHPSIDERIAAIRKLDQQDDRMGD
jgi:Zn-dependent protease with chaperone function